MCNKYFFLHKWIGKNKDFEFFYIIQKFCLKMRLFKFINNFNKAINTCRINIFQRFCQTLLFSKIFFFIHYSIIMSHDIIYKLGKYVPITIFKKSETILWKRNQNRFRLSPPIQIEMKCKNTFVLVHSYKEIHN